jgi:hypothetical protein
MATDSSIGASRWRRMSTVMSAKAMVRQSAERSPNRWPPPPIAIVPPTVMATPTPAIRLPTNVRRCTRSRNQSQAKIAVMNGSVAQMTVTLAMVVFCKA